jgi:hypothetical protein
MDPAYHYTGLIYSKDGLKFEAIEPIPFGKKDLPGIHPAEICAWIKHGHTYYAATDHVGRDHSTRVPMCPGERPPKSNCPARMPCRPCTRANTCWNDRRNQTGSRWPCLKSSLEPAATGMKACLLTGAVTFPFRKIAEGR